MPDAALWMLIAIGVVLLGLQIWYARKYASDSRAYQEALDRAEQDRKITQMQDNDYKQREARASAMQDREEALISRIEALVDRLEKR